MSYSNWTSPRDLKGGDTIAVLTPQTGKQYTVDIVCVRGNYAEGRCREWNGITFAFNYDTPDWVWKRIGAVPAPITQPSIATAAPVTYGATCRKCNEVYPHAEWRSGFVCYGCKVRM